MPNKNKKLPPATSFWKKLDDKQAYYFHGLTGIIIIIIVINIIIMRNLLSFKIAINIKNIKLTKLYIPP